MAGSLGGGLLALIAVLTFGAGPADAHATLISSSPGEGVVVDAVPAEVVLTFDEPVRLLPAAVRVLSPDGIRADLGRPRVLGATVRIPLRPGQARGTYLVSYAAVSDDGHRIGAAFTFSVGSTVGSTVGSASGANGSEPAAGRPGHWSGVISPPLRWSGYLGLSVLVGAALALWARWPRRSDRPRVTRLMWTGAVLIGITTTAELGEQILADRDGAPWSAAPDVLTSRSGQAHEARLVLLLVLAALLGPVLGGTARKGKQIVVAGLATAGFMTYALAGHPATAPDPVVPVLADTLHLAAVSLWLGGLLMLALFVLPRADDHELSTIVPRWSAWAGCAVSTVLLSGLVQALVQIRPASALWETGYGRLVLVKVGLLAVILIIALGSHRLATTMAQPVSSRPANRLRRLVAVESAGLLIVLAVTSVLVQTAPSRAAAGEPNAAAMATLRMIGRGAQVEFTLDPGRTGVNRLDLHALAPDGRTLAVKAWSGTASLPARGIERIDLRLLALTPDHAVGQVNLPLPGAWRFSVTLRDADRKVITLTKTITLK